MRGRSQQSFVRWRFDPAGNVQHWFNLSDPGVEEALYDSRALRRFVGIDLGREPAPDETTVCKFRHLLEEQGLSKRLFEQVDEYLKEHGMAVNRGTIVDATIIHAPSSTKNRRKERDPEMHQTRKGYQWYFGMKAHIGVDSRSKLIHSVEATAANVHDSQVLEKLLHGKERRVWGARSSACDTGSSASPASSSDRRARPTRRASGEPGPVQPVD